MIKKIFISLFLGLLSIPQFSSAELKDPKSFIELKTEGDELQTFQYSCGTASLATLMKIFGCNTSERELLDSVLPKKFIFPINSTEIVVEPLSLKDLETLSKKHNFKVISLKAHDEKSAYHAISCLSPVITRLKIYNQILHFVVVRSLDNEWVYISDPAYGNVYMPWKQFYAAMNSGDNVVLSISKDAFNVKSDSDGNITSIGRTDSVEKEVIADERPESLFYAAKMVIRFDGALKR